LRTPKITQRDREFDQSSLRIVVKNEGGLKVLVMDSFQRLAWGNL